MSDIITLIGEVSNEACVLSVARGIVEILPGKPPNNLFGKAFTRIANTGDPTTIDRDDTDSIIGLRLKIFVANNCGLLDDLRSRELWSAMFASAKEVYAQYILPAVEAEHPTINFPDQLPGENFLQPTINCDTSILNFITALRQGYRTSLSHS